jgi:hypothetical protein
MRERDENLLIERIAQMTRADSPTDRQPPTKEDGFVKWLQLGLLIVISAVLLLGPESVRSFPARVFSRPRPPQLDEGRRALESHNLPLAASLFSKAIELSRGAHRREAALLLAQVRVAQGSRRSALDVLRRYTPAVNTDSFFAQYPQQRDTSIVLREMDCDIGVEPIDSADARWCVRYFRLVRYLDAHPHADVKSAIAITGGYLDSATVVTVRQNLRERDAEFRSYCARTYGRPGEYGPFQQKCRDRGLVR